MHDPFIRLEQQIYLRKVRREDLKGRKCILSYKNCVLFFKGRAVQRDGGKKKREGGPNEGRERRWEGRKELINVCHHKLPAHYPKCLILFSLCCSFSLKLCIYRIKGHKNNPTAVLHQYGCPLW